MFNTLINTNAISRAKVCINRMIMPAEQLFGCERLVMNDKTVPVQMLSPLSATMKKMQTCALFHVKKPYTHTIAQSYSHIHSHKNWKVSVHVNAFAFVSHTTESRCAVSVHSIMCVICEVNCVHIPSVRGIITLAHNHASFWSR